MFRIPIFSIQYTLTKLWLCKLHWNSSFSYWLLHLVGYFSNSWKSKKQNVISQSFVESEYHVVVVTCEIPWLLHLLTDLMFLIIFQLTCFFITRLLHTFMSIQIYACTKYIQIDCHVIYENVQASLIRTAYVYTRNQIAKFLWRLEKIFFVHSSASCCS